MRILQKGTRWESIPPYEADASSLCTRGFIYRQLPQQAHACYAESSVNGANDGPATLKRVHRARIWLMKRKSPLLIAGCLTGLLVLAILLAAILAAVYLRYGGTDEPLDDSDMKLAVREMSDEQNAFVQLRKAASLVEWEEDEYYFIQTMIDGNPEPPELPQQFLQTRQEAVVALHRAFECRQSAYREMEDTENGFKKDALESVAWALWHDAEKNADVESQFELALNLIDAGNLLKASGGPLIVFLRGARLQRHGFIMLGRICERNELSLDAFEHAIERVAATQDDTGAIKNNLRANYWASRGMIDEELGSRQWQFWVYDEDQNTRAMLEKFRTLIRSSDGYFKDVVIPPDQFSDNAILMVLKGNALGDMLSDLLVPMTESNFKALAYDRSHNSAVQVILALKIYFMRHGELPESLDALVPEFFDELPRDWFDGGPIKYNRDEALVYCVGSDLENQGGSDPDEKWFTSEDPSWSIAFASQR